jgi:Rod binding domain-containing protein
VTKLEGSAIQAAVGLDASQPGSLNRNDRSPEAIARAASKFEALLVSQLLQAGRGEDGWLGTDQDEADSTLAEMAEQTLSEALSSKGGLGLAKLVNTGLSRTANKD